MTFLRRVTMVLVGVGNWAIFDDDPPPACQQCGKDQWFFQAARSDAPHTKPPCLYTSEKPTQIVQMLFKPFPEEKPGANEYTFVPCGHFQLTMGKWQKRTTPNNFNEKRRIQNHPHCCVNPWSHSQQHDTVMRGRRRAGVRCHLPLNTCSRVSALVTTPDREAAGREEQRPGQVNNTSR